MKKYVIVGASYRCYAMFVANLTEKYKDTVALTGVYDINRHRAEFFRQKIGANCTVYDSFEKMLNEEKPDGVLVTTNDRFHHEYIVRALDMGYDVISEKPLTNTYERCLAVREAEKRSGRRVKVTFNCRFMPHFLEIKKLLCANKIGKVLAVNYEYYLNRWHGGDYFKRWHRLMENSQGMLLHKSTHHFDIINWFLEDEPVKVAALGNRVFYADSDKCHGERCSQCSFADRCESSHSPSADVDKDLYFEAEKEDGYIRDRCCYRPDSDINDNMSVSVLYKKGTILTYSLNLFSVREGYRLTLTGEKGVLELNEVKLGDHEDDSFQINLYYCDGTSETVSVQKGTGMHLGGDEKMISMLFGEENEDHYNQCADSFAGVVSAMIGVAGNMSIEKNETIDLSQYLDTLR